MDERTMSIIGLVLAAGAIWLAYDIYKESTHYHSWSKDPVLKRNKKR